MNIRTAVSCALLTTLALSSAPSQAEGMRDHDSHVHGAALLNLALEGGVLEAELISPAANIVGFEHAPRDAAERERVAAAAKQLRDGARLLGIPAEAKCRVAELEVESALLDEEHDHHAEGEEKHDDHRHEGEEKHDDHHHEGEKEHAEEEHGGHSEFHVHYHLECAEPAALERLSLGLFNFFPGVESLRVQAVGPNGQRADELSGERSEFRF